MAETGNWYGHVFTVSPTLIRGFTGLTIKGSADTQAKTTNKQQYLSLKNGKAVDIAMTVELNSSTGCDVREEALAFVDEATQGATGYFYIGGQKLVPCQLMLTEAGVDDVEISPSGIWTIAKVKLALKQATLLDGTKVTFKKKPPAKPGYVDWSKLKESPAQINKAKDTIKKVVNDARAASLKKPIVKPSVKGRLNYTR